MALLVLLGSMGAAQAQNVFYEIKLFATPNDFVREGGKSEVSGDVLLNFDPMPQNTLTATLKYSVPLAGDIASGMVGPTGEEDEDLTTSINTTVVGVAEDEDNDGNGTITISAFTDGNTANLLVRNVMLDVSAASGPITVTVSVKSSMDTDFVRIDGQNSAMVIGGIKVGVKASATATTVRTRGTDADGKMVSLTLEESFDGAFMDLNMVTVDFSGIPEGATLTAELTGIVITDAMADPAVRAEATDPYATVGAVKDGSVTVLLGGMEGTLQRATPEKVTLELTLTAIPPDDDEEMSFPLARSNVMARATFTDPTGLVNNFEDAFTDYVTVFNIRPAQCELLFQVVTVKDAWNTAISVTNPAYEEEMASGGLLFTFYGMGDVVATYDTTVDPIAGVGLEADGTLSPGGTYQVLAHEILLAADWGETFQGHVHLLADYTNCSGLGWVTDFMTVNQAYSAIVIDADTGGE